MSSVVISGDTSGAITLAAPAVAGTNTITLPASTGTMLTTGSPQSGGVIQTVQATSTSTFSTTSTTFVTTSFSASITPKFSTSKVLALISGNGFQGLSSAQVWITLYRGATELSGATNGFNGISNGVGGIIGVLNFSYVDSPATTSSTTYTIYIRGSAGTAYFNSNNSVSAIQLLEIAA